MNGASQEGFETDAGRTADPSFVGMTREEGRLRLELLEGWFIVAFQEGFERAASGTADPSSSLRFGRDDKGRGVAQVGVVGGMGRLLISCWAVILLDLLEWMAARKGAQVPAHRPAGQRLGFCPARSVRSLPNWPGRQAVRRNLDLALSQLHHASRHARPKYYKGICDAQGW